MYTHISIYILREKIEWRKKCDRNKEIKAKLDVECVLKSERCINIKTLQ